MATTSLDRHRLDLAGTREFTRPGAGPARRARLAAYSREWIDEVWQQAARGTRAHSGQGVALAAVGSLARGDSGPLSDLDLVLLHDGRTMSMKEITALADRLWYPIWDAGVKLDHSVRTLHECRQVAASDLTATVGMLDIDHLAGDPVIVAGVRQSIAHDWRANARKRLPELAEALTMRHARMGDLTTSIEPDVKEGRGGLRDMTVLRALTSTWLADRPRGEVDDAYEKLLDVRDALHVATGRGRDRLIREDQDAVAALLGHPDADALLTEVVQCARRVSFALDRTMRQAGQAQRARTLRVGPRRPSLSPIGYGLFEHDKEVVLGPRPVAGDDHLLLMRAARLAAAHALPIAPATMGNLIKALRPLPTPWPEELTEAFVDLLGAGHGLPQVWEDLDLAGVIDLWLPEWRAVRSRPQRNAVHQYTVDRHLVETVVEAAGRKADVERPDLLLITALLHDIGKISGVHDHAVEGAPVAGNIARRMGLDSEDVGVIELLVREHLTLVDLATRRDPRDPQTVNALIAAVEERRDILDLLTVLSEADAIAAGPKAWTPWRAQLVLDLAARGRSALGDRHATPIEPGRDVTLSDEQMKSIALGMPHVSVVPRAGGALITIADRDRLGLFADSAGLLSAHSVVVRAARVATVDGAALNRWQVETPDGDMPDAALLQRGLVALAKGDRSSLRGLERRARKAPIGSAPTRATVVPAGSANATVIEVRTADRPGLLRDIGMTFARFNLAVRSAHVATYAGQTLDTFYVTAAGGTQVSPPRVAQVIAALIDACDGVGAR